MKDRIKLIRKNAGVNQTQFAESVSLSRMMITHVETGNAVLSDRSLNEICRVYKVNKHWLLTGEGEPYKPISRNQQIAEFIDDLLMEDVDESFRKRLVLTLSSLSVDEWALLEKIADDLTKKKES